MSAGYACSSALNPDGSIFSPKPSSGLLPYLCESLSSKLLGSTWHSSMAFSIVSPSSCHRTPLLIDFSISVYLTTIPTIFREVYHHSTGIAGLHYFALGIGLTCASQLNARYMDKIYVILKNKNGGIGEPEFRVRECLYGSFTLYELLTCFLFHSFHDSWVSHSACWTPYHWLVCGKGRPLGSDRRWTSFCGRGNDLEFPEHADVRCGCVHALCCFRCVLSPSEPVNEMT